MGCSREWQKNAQPDELQMQNFENFSSKNRLDFRDLAAAYDEYKFSIFIHDQQNWAAAVEDMRGKLMANECKFH